jgi:hypothetical protein
MIDPIEIPEPPEGPEGRMVKDPGCMIIILITSLIVLSGSSLFFSKDKPNITNQENNEVALNASK